MLKLADYQKAIPDIERAKALIEADNDGRVIVLPCKEGTPVYYVEFENGEYVIKTKPFSFVFINHVKWGRLFLTVEEAEVERQKAIKEAEEKRQRYSINNM